MSVAELPVRPALRYFGAKWQLGPRIIAHLPAHLCYCEPFAGSAGIFFRKPPSRIEVLNDLDERVVTFFRVLRDRPADLVRALELTPYSRAEYIRAFEPATDDIEIARRFYVTSWQSYFAHQEANHAGWRFMRALNRRSRTTVEDWAKLEHLHALAFRLRAAYIECDDALAVIRRFDGSDTLFLCDPPYVAATRTARWARSGYRHDFTDADHQCLADALHQVSGMVVLCSYPSELYDGLYRDWQTVNLSARDGQHRATVERLYVNPAAAAERRQLRLAEVPA